MSRRVLGDAAVSDPKRQCAAALECARETDSFDTHPDVASRCVGELLRAIAERPGAVVEPSAGAGNFVRAIGASELGAADVTALDLYRGGDGVQVGVDFLAWMPPSDVRRPLWVVGNPPFGRLAATALAFFGHAANFADVIAFIVPREFRRRANCADARFTLVAEHVLERRSFVIGAEAIPYAASTVWQVWRRVAAGETRVYRTPTLAAPAPALAQRVQRMPDAAIEQLLAAARDDTPAALGQRFADAGGILMARASSTPGRVCADAAAVGTTLRRLRRLRRGSVDRGGWYLFCVPSAADRDALVAAQHGASSGLCVQGSITLPEAYALMAAALDAPL